MTIVSSNALVGSPRRDDTASGDKNGIIPSFAIAWNLKKTVSVKHLQTYLKDFIVITQSINLIINFIIMCWSLMYHTQEWIYVCNLPNNIVKKFYM